MGAGDADVPEDDRREGGDTGSTTTHARLERNVGAWIMGRNMFGPIRGDWGDESWRGWWGEKPPYHAPVFVLTHHAREPLEMEGGTTFHFVTDGIEAALEQATEAAGGKDVRIAGGASTAGSTSAPAWSTRWSSMSSHSFSARRASFRRLDGGPAGLECVELVSSPAVAHYRYVKKGG